MASTATSIAALTNVADDIVNKPSTVMSNENSIRTTMNTAFSITASIGHTHNNVDSAYTAMGIGGFTSADFMFMMIGGGIS